MKKRKKTIILLIIGGIFIIAPILIYAIYIEPRQMTCQYVTLTVPKLPKELDGLKLGVVSDLHLRPSVMGHGLFDKMFAELEANQPDMIFILGDIMNNLRLVGNLTYPELEAFLKRFHAPQGVYVVVGNHDRNHIEEGLGEALKAANMTLLVDALISVDVNGTALQLAGVNNYKEGYSNFVEIFKEADFSQPIILLTHNPEVFHQRYNCAEVTIAGHTHGGQIRVPFLLNGENTLLNWPMPYFRGVYNIRDRALAVTSGVGTSHFEMRLGCTPEIMLVTLKK